MNKFMTAIAGNSEQPLAAFEELEQLVQKTIGFRLFTLMELNHERGVAQRCYLNRPEAYPVLGEI
jgi:hypothetical protein